MSGVSGTPDERTIDDLRDQVAEVDRAIVEAVNRRLELVARLKRAKERAGIGFLDPQREAWLLEHFRRSNRGPLSDEGLQRLHSELLALTKDEVALIGEDASEDVSSERRRGER
jgi:chorismate mutase